MKILVINSGSSSIKYQFFSIGGATFLCKGNVERIGLNNSVLTHQKQQQHLSVKVKAANHNDAIRHIFAILSDPKEGVIKSYRQISGIGHRVVHGAEEFTQPTVITDTVIKNIEKFNKLAPLHNPPSLLGIKACRRFAKNIIQVAVFDTSFHQTMPAYAYIYGIPYHFYQDMRIRRYGFHGTSHKYVAKRAAEILRRNLKDLRIITCHLGNGCSITAVKNGVSIDTSMGFTPLEGLLMGTRCGDIDPTAVLYIMEKKGLNIKQMSDILNKKSGLLGLSGTSSDMRDILKEVKVGKTRARLAFEIFLYRIKKYIGAYAASMDGLDAVVLTAGIGENESSIKERLREDLKLFLAKFKARILVIPTNEELMIAHETAHVITRFKK
jgi:acetate kinase